MADRQVLKNANHHIVGYIDTDSSGRQVILNEFFHKLGEYDPRTNRTVDEFYHRVGSGNLLTTLLKPQ